MAEQEQWIIAERPGYQGKRKDLDIARWNQQYGEGNYKRAWLAGTEVWDYDDVFWKIYVGGYTKFLIDHPEVTANLATNHSFTYDKDLVSREQAFDYRYLYDRPGFANQFHNVALNIALEYFIGEKFQGLNPLQVREGKPGTDPSTWPEGWVLSPSRIPLVDKSLTLLEGEIGWWQEGSIEDFYQRNKILLVRATS